MLDQTIESINRKMQFKISFDREEVTNALYYEPSLQGNAVVCVNENEEDTKLDLELLYKAVVTNGHAVRDVFNKRLEKQVN